MNSPYLNFNSTVNDWCYFERLLAGRLPLFSRIVDRYKHGKFLFVRIELPKNSYDFMGKLVDFRFDCQKYTMQEARASDKTVWV